MANRRVFPKILAEGYCCMYGYISLCKARGESTRDMAFWLNIPPRTMRYQVHLWRTGKLQCQGIAECIDGAVKEVAALMDRTGQQTPVPRE